ncbi:MAG: hypothetical protein ACFBSC_09980 [Microcoleaceae cyanobacterium]
MQATDLNHRQSWSDHTWSNHWPEVCTDKPASHSCLFAATSSSDIIPIFPQRDADTSFLPFIQSATQVSLTLDKLNCFETVDDQFRHWRIRFMNAIALQPSNPAYGIDPGAIVLMGAPDSGWLEIEFAQPISRIEAQVTSSRPTVLCAYDAAHQEIAQAEMSLAKSTVAEISTLPRSQLSLAMPGMSKVIFSTFDGQLVINQLQLQF